MSVINQMLKDLDERSPEPINQAAVSGNVLPTHSTKNIIAVTAITVLITCFICFYVWHIISENNTLKAEKASSQTTLEKSVAQVNSKNKVVATSKEESTTKATEVKKTPNNSSRVKDDIEAAELGNNKEKNSGSVEIASSGQLAFKSTENELENKLQPITAKAIQNNNSTRVTPVKKLKNLTEEQEHSENSIGHSYTEKKARTKKANANKMTISRRQLSGDELAEQKLTLAEKALAAKQVSKAEKLLEEVVILKPSDSQTRKKLAALWYGRKAYQDALNILSQGISLDRKDSSLRELKARIHLHQKQYMAALNTLKPLSQLKNEPYQVLLANTAQQAKHNEIAVNAYQVLISMQPEAGRWYLGLAVLYDKNSQFSLASAAYKKALTKSDLSVSSESFIKQRIEIIGQ